MTLSPLVPIGAAAAGSVVGQILDRLADASGAFAELLAPAEGQELSVDGHRSPDLVGDSELHRVAGQALTEFRFTLQQRLAEAGLTTSLSYQLQGDGQSGVRVVSDHPRRDQIEQVINSDEGLLAAFHYLSATHALLAAAQRHRDFTERYVDDPVLGSVELSRMLQADDGTFALTVNGDTVEVGFV